MAHCTMAYALHALHALHTALHTLRAALHAARRRTKAPGHGQPAVDPVYAEHVNDLPVVNNNTVQLAVQAEDALDPCQS